MVVTEPTFCPMYVQLLKDLNEKLPRLPSDEPSMLFENEITVKHALLNLCQEAFEDAENLRAKLKQITDPDRARNASPRFLGNIRLNGELFKQRMDSEWVVHTIGEELLGTDPKSCPAEENVEATYQFFGTIAGCTNTRNRLGNGGYLNQGIGYNAEYIGQGIGRANQNFEMLNSFHPKTPRDPEKETRNRFGIGCDVEYIGKGTGMANGNLDMLNNVDPDIQRAFEKQKIREEIIAGEMARRRELEAEVREELRIEREMALRMKSGNVFDGVRVSMESIVRPVEESLRMQGRTQTSRMENIVKPFQQTSIESKVDETGQEKGKNNFLAKPDLKEHFTGSKRRFMRAVLKARQSAAIRVEAVQISQIAPPPPPIATAKPLGGHGTSVSTLPEKKKKAMVKENFKLQKKTVKISGIKPLMPTPPPIATAKPVDGHGNSASILPGNKDKEKGKEKFASWSEMGTAGANNKYLMKRSENKKKEKGKEKFAFWCEMCNAGANNKSMMEAHKKGKKHLEKLQKTFPFWCDVCKFGAHVGHIMEAHLKGRKHLKTLQGKAASTTSAQAKIV